MNAADAMILLRRFKDIDAGILPETPSKNNPKMTVKEAWYLVFKALLQTHPDAIMPEDFAKMIQLEFELDRKAPVMDTVGQKK